MDDLCAGYKERLQKNIELDIRRRSLCILALTHPDKHISLNSPLKDSLLILIRVHISST